MRRERKDRGIVACERLIGAIDSGNEAAIDAALRRLAEDIRGGMPRNVASMCRKRSWREVFAREIAALERA